MSFHNDTYGHLNCSIMNYYKRFGQNRDLERFLRLQRSYGNCNKSSSEGSLYHPATSTMNYEYQNVTSGGVGCDDNLGRSLQNLSILRNNSASSSRDKLNTSKFSSDSKKSNDHLSETGGEDEDIGAADDEKSKTPVNEEKSIVAKEQITKSKKGVNINFESFIEINMPNQQQNEVGSDGVGGCKQKPYACHQNIPTPIMPQPPTTIVNIPSVMEILAPRKIFTSSDKMIQTQHDKGSQIESPIVPTPTPKPTVNQSFHEETQPNYSPSSSIGSRSKHKLEWDSGADVGYCKKPETNIENGLTSIERNALVKLFANYGLNFDSNVVLFSASKSGTKSEENAGTSQAHSDEIRQKWQNLCEKILLVSKKSDQPQFVAHSTPMDGRKSSMKDSTEVKLIDQISRIEKFCQTSNTELKSFGVQVSAERSHSASDESAKTLPSIDNKSVGKYENEGKSNDNSSSESFKFVSGADYLKKKESPQSDASKNAKSPRSSLDGMTLKSISSSSNFDLSKLNDNPCYKNLSKLEKNLTVGINLMNSLLQSKSLSVESKNQLIKKILTKLEKIIQKTCGGSNKILEFYQNQLKDIKNKSPSQDSGPIETPSSAPGINSTPNSKESTKSSSHSSVEPSADEQSNKKYEQDCKPPTGSDGSKKKHEPTSTAESYKKTSKPVDNRLPSKSSQTAASLASSSSRKSEWLEPMTHSELNYELSRQKKQMKEISNGTKFRPDQTEADKQMQLSLIEANIMYLEKLKIYLKNGGTKENLKFDIQPSKNSEPPDNETKRSSSLSWNSHLNLKDSHHKKLSSRSKLDTPKHVDSNESINTFARHKKEDFIEKYNHNRIPSANADFNQVVYTKPYSHGVANKPPMGGADYYSNPHINRNTKHSNNSTSLTSSNVFLTSDNASTSLSIAKSSSKSTPTSLQFQENILNIGTQTSDSLRLMKPVFESKRSAATKTKMVKSTVNNKGNQMTPRSIGYTITFNEDSNRRVREKRNGATATKDTNDTDNYYFEKPIYGPAAPKVGEFISNSNIPSRCSSVNDIHNYVFSLQTHLNEKRPDFMVRAEERRMYIHDVNEKRRYRNTEREKILNGTSNQSMNSKLTQLPKTRPANNHRLFSTKQIKMQTKRKYSTLPEVVQRKEVLKENQLRKNNKRIMDIFNKNLQKQVLKGKVTLSNSLVLV